MSGRFRGHAAVFNQAALIGTEEWGFYEEVDPEAFRRALRERQDVAFLYGHDPDKLLARTTSGTAKLSTDGLGLVVDADLAPTTVGSDVRILLERKDLSRMSFAFIARRDRWEDGPGGVPLRRLLDVDLYDVSVVTYPAYEGTSAQLLSEEDRKRDIRVRLLRFRLAASEERLTAEGRFRLQRDRARRRIAQAKAGTR